MSFVSVLGPETTALIAAGLLVFLNAIWTGGDDNVSKTQTGGQPGAVMVSHIAD